MGSRHSFMLSFVFVIQALRPVIWMVFFSLSSLAKLDFTNVKFFETQASLQMIVFRVNQLWAGNIGN